MDGWGTLWNRHSAPPSYLVAGLVFWDRDFRDGEVRDAGRGLGSLSMECERQSSVRVRRVRTQGGVTPARGTRPHLGDLKRTRTRQLRLNELLLQQRFSGLLPRLELLLLILLCGPASFGLAGQTDPGQVDRGHHRGHGAGPVPDLSLRTDSRSQNRWTSWTRRSWTRSPRPKKKKFSRRFCRF